jgi:hypothetical protein
MGAEGGAKKDKTAGMKSAYELALERMEALGVERPREEALPEATRQAIAEARRVTESKLAELEILHRDKMRKLDHPDQLAAQEEFYRLERDRLTSDGEERVAKLRAATGG